MLQSEISIQVRQGITSACACLHDGHVRCTGLLYKRRFGFNSCAKRAWGSVEDVKGSFEQLHMHQQGRVFPYLYNEDNDLLVLDNSIPTRYLAHDNQYTCTWRGRLIKLAWFSIAPDEALSQTPRNAPPFRFHDCLRTDSEAAYSDDVCLDDNAIAISGLT